MAGRCDIDESSVARQRFPFVEVISMTPHLHNPSATIFRGDILTIK
jgi:hypothetical protein